MRRLPPKLPESLFRLSITPFLPDILDCNYALGDLTYADLLSQPFNYFLRTNGARNHFLESKSKKKYLTLETPRFDEIQSAHCDSSLGDQCFARAYLAFRSADRMLAFARAFDGHRFRNAEGTRDVNTSIDHNGCRRGACGGGGAGAAAVRVAG